MQVVQHVLKSALTLLAKRASQGGPAFPGENADQKSRPEKFLADPSSTIASGACPQLSSFWANLQQHLTNLKIEPQPGKGNTQLESLGSLTALKSLMILPEGPYRPGPPRYDMSEAKLVLEMRNLEFLFVCSLSNGELVLSGPRVEHA